MDDTKKERYGKMLQSQKSTVNYKTTLSQLSRLAVTSILKHRCRKGQELREGLLIESTKLLPTLTNPKQKL